MQGSDIRDHKNVVVWVVVWSQPDGFVCFVRLPIQYDVFGVVLIVKRISVGARRTYSPPPPILLKNIPECC